MNLRFACPIVASLAFATGPSATTADSSAVHPGSAVEVVVDGAPLQRYAHRGRWYVEALDGREYALRIRNPYAVRVAVALSVDGLNTIDARQTTASDARKWVLDPYETIIISGWQTSRTEARRFEFTTEARSYGQALGRTANLGVISAVFFKERVFPMSKEYADRGQAAAPQASESAGRASPTGDRDEAAAKYAATGMGRRTAHAVTQVSMDLEHTPAQTVNIRYEFRPQLVRLGILPSAPGADPLQRRERAQGFEYCPESR